MAHDSSKGDRTGDILPNEDVDFAGLFLSDAILQGLDKAGFRRPSPIQLKAIPIGRCGLDLIVQAKSGTGKTAVFTVIALEGLDLESSAIQVLVLTPTREIALQIQSVVTSIGCAMSQLSCHTFIGGTPLNEDRKKLLKCHIAIGTPGRLRQLVELGALKTSGIRTLVLDEADKLMEDGFQTQINWLYSVLPESKQFIAASATYPEVLAEHLTTYMRNPTFVRLNSSDPALLGIRQYYQEVEYHPLAQKAFDNKVEGLVSILSSVTFDQCLVFSNYQVRAASLSSVLNSKGWPAAFISGSLDQNDRVSAMEKLKALKCRVLISTDLTSRGIDAEHVNLVINLDLPHDHETYLHRIGRAGRFGRYGAGVTLVCSGQERAELCSIEAKCNTSIATLPQPVPENLAQSSGYVYLGDLVTAEKLTTNEKSGANKEKAIHNEACDDVSQENVAHESAPLDAADSELDTAVGSIPETQYERDILLEIGQQPCNTCNEYQFYKVIGPFNKEDLNGPFKCNRNRPISSSCDNEQKQDQTGKPKKVSYIKNLMKIVNEHIPESASNEKPSDDSIIKDSTVQNKPFEFKETNLSTSVQEVFPDSSHSKAEDSQCLSDECSDKQVTNIAPTIVAQDRRPSTAQYSSAMMTHIGQRPCQECSRYTYSALITPITEPQSKLRSFISERTFDGTYCCEYSQKFNKEKLETGVVERNVEAACFANSTRQDKKSKKSNKLSKNKESNQLDSRSDISKVISDILSDETSRFKFPAAPDISDVINVAGASLVNPTPPSSHERDHLPFTSYQEIQADLVKFVCKPGTEFTSCVQEIRSQHSHVTQDSHSDSVRGGEHVRHMEALMNNLHSEYIPKEKLCLAPTAKVLTNLPELQIQSASGVKTKQSLKTKVVSLNASSQTDSGFYKGTSGPGSHGNHQDQINQCVPRGGKENEFTEIAKPRTVPTQHTQNKNDEKDTLDEYDSSYIHFQSADQHSLPTLGKICKATKKVPDKLPNASSQSKNTRKSISSSSSEELHINPNTSFKFISSKTKSKGDHKSSQKTKHKSSHPRLTYDKTTGRERPRSSSHTSRESLHWQYDMPYSQPPYTQPWPPVYNHNNPASMYQGSPYLAWIQQQQQQLSSYHHSLTQLSYDYSKMQANCDAQQSYIRYMASLAAQH